MQIAYAFIVNKGNSSVIQWTHHATTLAPLRIPVVQSLVSFFASEHMSGSSGFAFGHLTMLWFALLSIGTWDDRRV